MVADPQKQRPHEQPARLDPEGPRANGRPARVLAAPAPLQRDDIVLTTPILPDDESADALIAAVRQWRREGERA